METSPGLGCLQELGLKEELGWQSGRWYLVVQLALAGVVFPCVSLYGLKRKQLV